MPSPQHSLTAELAVESACLLGEGPVWSAAESRLLWVDIKAPSIWSMAWPSRDFARREPSCRVSALAPRRSGGFVAACDQGFAVLNAEGLIVQPVDHPEAHLPGNRFNDGKVDGSGAFWVGTMDDAEEAESGALYRLDADLRWARMDSGYRVPNGPTFSPDGDWLYHSDSARQQVFRYPLHPDGSLGPRELFLQFGEADGFPDGMTTDAEGCVWIAFWDGWCVRRFVPGSAALERIDLSVQRPISCAFGGNALDQLFITSARIGLSERQLAAQTHAGDLFVARPTVSGMAPTPFAG